MAGLYNREVIARFLGKRVAEIERMIEEDQLPALGVPSGQRIRHKFAAAQLLLWLNARTKNQAWTLEQLLTELDRCEAALTSGKRQKMEVAA